MPAISVIRCAQPRSLHPLTAASGIAVALAAGPAEALPSPPAHANDDCAWPSLEERRRRTPQALTFVHFLRPGGNS